MEMPKTEMNDAFSFVRGLEKNLTDLAKKIESKDAEIEAIRAQCQTFKAQAHIHEQKNVELQKQLHFTKTKLEEVRTESIQAQGALQEFEMIQSEMKVLLDSKKALESELRKWIQTQKKEATRSIELEAENEALRAQAQSLREQSLKDQQAQLQYKATVDQFVMTEAKKNQEILELRNQIQSLQVENQKNLIEFMEKERNFSSEKQTLEQKIQKLESDLYDHEVQVQELRSQANERQSQKKYLHLAKKHFQALRVIKKMWKLRSFIGMGKKITHDQYQKLATWESQLGSYRKLMVNSQTNITEILTWLTNEVHPGITTLPLKSILEVTERERLQLEIQLGKLPNSSNERVALEEAYTKTMQQREFLRNLMEKNTVIHQRTFDHAKALLDQVKQSPIPAPVRGPKELKGHHE